LLIEAFILKSVCVNLSLVILELSDHILELLGTLLQVLLIHLQLLSHLWPRLFRQYILELNVQFLFLLNQHILL